MSNFSENEKKLFMSLGFYELMKNFERDPISLYDLAIKQAFLSARQETQAVQALRRAGRAIMNSTIFRGTEKFERLIEFEK